jgi:hypothetical protein
MNCNSDHDVMEFEESQAIAQGDDINREASKVNLPVALAPREDPF